MPEASRSKRFWNRAARENAAWYIATRFTSANEEFFASGAREVDAFLGAAALRIAAEDTVLEIGCGAGRMTRRLAQLAGCVIAADVSGEMLERARANLEGRGAVRYLELDGDGALPLKTASVDAVFSYITMQHVPTAAAQERYVGEAVRVLRPGGWAYLQFRRGGPTARALDWAGHLAHRLRGRRTLDRAWRGSRVSPAALRRAAGAEATVSIRRSGRRHVWVLARRR